MIMAFVALTNRLNHFIILLYLIIAVASDWVGPGAETSTFHPAAEWTDVTAQVSHVPRVQ